jgi:hypothetical protein
MTGYSKMMDHLISEFLNKINIPESEYIVDVKEVVEQYFKYAYSIGFDEGRSQTAHRRKVEQYKDGVLICCFDSMMDAARHMGVDKTAISKSIIKNRKDKHGNIWVTTN